MKLKKVLIISIILLTAAIIIAIAFIFFTPPKLSPSQQNTIELLGNPAHFIINYLPQGDDQSVQLIRQETWYYPEHNKQITFLAGQIISADELPQDFQDNPIPPTNLKPQDFEFSQNYDQIAKALKSSSIEPIDLPGFSQSEEHISYLSDQAIFVIEYDHLTYFQTISSTPTDLNILIPFDDQNQLTSVISEDETSTLESIEVPDNLKSYSSSDMGFSIQYPKEWFLSYGILSNYDMNYMINGEQPPEQILKCDFTPDNPSAFDLINPTIITNTPISIIQGQAVTTEEDTMTMGENVTFILSDSDHPPIALICYFYEPDLLEQLKTILPTLKFID